MGVAKIIPVIKHLELLIRRYCGNAMGGGGGWVVVRGGGGGGGGSKNNNVYTPNALSINLP